MPCEVHLWFERKALEFEYTAYGSVALLAENGKVKRQKAVPNAACM